jgi:hypothetical protein
MARSGFALSASAALVAGSCLVPSFARAQGDSAAWRANTGFVTGTGLALLVPEEGSVGGGIELTGRYGIPAGPIVLAPGALLGGYYLQERFIGVLMPTFRITLPLGPLAPFAQGGAGIGGISNPGEGGLAWLGGGGLMIHFGGIFALGAEINYQGISGTDYKVLSIGPSILIGG